MKNIFLFLIGTAVLCTALFAQEIPQEWDRVIPRDTPDFRYKVGVSAPAASEQASANGARNDALKQFASSIVTNVSTEETELSFGQDLGDGVLEVRVTYKGEASFSSKIQLSGFSEIDRKVEKGRNGEYIGRSLTRVSVEDYNKARYAVDNEPAAARSYRFFVRNIPALANAPPRPAGYEDYMTWLMDYCVILSIQNRDDPSLEQFVKKLYKKAVVCHDIINGQKALIVYDADARYANGVFVSLQKSGLFDVQRENAVIVLNFLRQKSLADFRAYINRDMKPSKVVITGRETVQFLYQNNLNPDKPIAKQFETIVASPQIGITAGNFSLPPSLMNERFLNEDEMFAYVQRNIASFPARYLAVCYSETAFDAESYAVTAFCRFTLYDVVTGDVYQSETADSRERRITATSSSEPAILAASRDALKFLTDKSNSRSLPAIVKKVFDLL
ncbi:MAG: hypothetical protein LBK25_08445 [Treponema sp.]|jgi:hypothetical protein|nr:hypothetical protein [Treponema sp.]